MKKITIFCLMMLSIFLSGCGDSLKMEGKIVKDKTGQLYLIHFNVGDTYTIEMLDTNKLITDW